MLFHRQNNFAFILSLFLSECDVNSTVHRIVFLFNSQCQRFSNLNVQTVTWELHPYKLLCTRDSDLTGGAEEAQESALQPAPRASEDHACTISLICVLLLALWLFVLFCWPGIQKTWVLVLCVVSRVFLQLRI